MIRALVVHCRQNYDNHILISSKFKYKHFLLKPFQKSELLNKIAGKAERREGLTFNYHFSLPAASRFLSSRQKKYF